MEVVVMEVVVMEVVVQAIVPHLVCIFGVFVCFSLGYPLSLLVKLQKFFRALSLLVESMYLCFLMKATH